MSDFLDNNLIDYKNNVIISACKINKKLENPKPYIYLNQNPQNIYNILNPYSRNMK